MALQDLTPQLRTRLSRVERAVGWFVLLAVGLLAFGFFYYLYNTAQNKGWFKQRATYYTMLDSSAGLRVGDPVMLMGFTAGRITDVKPMPPGEWYNIYVEFEIMEPNYGYLWTQGSRVKINSDLLGQRTLEVTKGKEGYPIYVFNPLREMTIAQAEAMPGKEDWKLATDIWHGSGTNQAILLHALTPLNGSNLTLIASLGNTEVSLLDTRVERKHPTAMWNDQAGAYKSYDPEAKAHYWLVADESPAVSERAEKLIAQAENALPGILDLTNKINAVLTNTANMSSNFNALAMAAQPLATNLAALSAELGKPGAIGELLIPTNLNQQLDITLASVNTNLALLSDNIGRTLNNLADITSNLNAQVQANTNVLSSVSDAVVHADELVQGLKRHWLLRSAFKEKTEKKSGESADNKEPLRSPRDAGRPR